MTKPIIGEHDATTGRSWEREMTEEEYAALIESGWTPGELEEATKE